MTKLVTPNISQSVMPQPKISSSVSRAAIARHYGINGGSVSAWVKGGCPQLPNGTFILAEVEKWLRERDEKKAGRADLREQKLQAEIDRIKRQISMHDMEIDRQREAVHGKAECAKSLTMLLSDSLNPLLSLHTRIKTAYPELPQNVIEAIAAQVDAAFEQIREGLK